MRHVTRLCIGATAAMTLSVVAQAADMRAPVSKSPAMTWTGWYVGASAGYGWSNSNVDPTGSAVFCNPTIGGCITSPTFSNAQVAAIPPTLPTHPSGAVLGGHIGYNYQTSAWVTGVETDISWTGINGSNTQTGAAESIVAGFLPASIAAQAIAEQHLRYFGTVRGRLGYLPAESLLLFVTGGLAYGQVKATTTLAEATLNAAGLNPTPGLGSVSTTKAGWTAGFGAEYVFPQQQHWSLKAEYLYFDLGSVNYPSTTMTLATPGGVPFTAVAASSSSKITGSIFRAGLNYMFN
jgi:outer membrane immunogenic protein